MNSRWVPEIIHDPSYWPWQYVLVLRRGYYRREYYAFTLAGAMRKAVRLATRLEGT